MASRVPKTCENCNAAFAVPMYRAETARFCSHNCGLVHSRAVRWARHRKSEVERLAQYQVRRGDEECWGWSGFKHNGYGRLSRETSVGHRTVGAHRLSYELANGPIPAGLTVLHACDNPECTNPRHLSLGTNADNNADRDAKGRQAKGERNPSAKLNPDIVRTIRQSPLSTYKLAAIYGVGAATVYQARVGKTWAHVPNPLPIKEE